MEKKIVDARGLACPLPVVNAKKAAEELHTGDVLTVLVDNEIAVQNLQKFAKQLLFDKDVNVGVQMPVGKSNFVLSGDRFVKKKAKPYGHKIIDL